MGNTYPKTNDPPGIPVHPHVCGEHIVLALLLYNVPGSSPRLWGTPAPVAIDLSWVRFIPTSVGNTRNTPPIYLLYTVHPHVCGEHALDKIIPKRSDGSSPRLWGTLQHAAVTVIGSRFIPTSVGNTLFFVYSHFYLTVHPHVCGEHFFDRFRIPVNIGSSPRLWGTPQHPQPAKPLDRFIPTSVGNTIGRWFLSIWNAVHPHVCGEHGCYGQCLLTNHGSSPRLWGTRHDNNHTHNKHGFIPTSVGNTLRSSHFFFLSPVHPHVCGEHHTRRSVWPFGAGSSPRLWGTRKDTHSLVSFILVHPHVCGEHDWVVE